MNYAEESLKMHYNLKGKFEIKARASVDTKEALSLAYTPGVAQPCLEIQKDPGKSFDLTRRWNTVAVVTDGTAVLGLGDIGPEAGMPVMEGKCVLFKAFGDVDAIPLCIRSKNVDEIVQTIRLFSGSFGGMNPIKEEMAEITNFKRETGTLKEVIWGADVFIGVSAPGTLTADMVRTMAENPIIFACANPTPEIFPDEAKAAGAAVVSTGRSDFPNQVNNVLCFPGMFRGALDVRARDINDEMKIAAAYAIAGLVSDEELRADYILPAAFDPRVKDAVAKAVADAAIRSGAAR